MSTNLTINPFVVQPLKPRRSEFKPEENRAVQLAREKERLNNSLSNPQKSNSRASESRNIFKLTPHQSQSLNNLNSQGSNRKISNQPIAQYLQTENINQREELESLVRLDIFA